MAAKYTVGPSLRAERERQGLALSRIARDTSIAEDLLAAIESERADLLPPPTFVKGFIRAYAGYLLHEDPEGLVHTWESTHGEVEISAAIPEPVKVPKAARPAAWRAASAVAAVTLVALGVFGAFKPVESPTATAPELATAPTLQSADLDAVSDLSAPAIVVLEVDRDETWVSVVADGVPAFQGTITASTARTFVGKSSVELTIGNPEVAKLGVNGFAPERIEAAGTFRTVVTPSTRTATKAQ